jgi:nitrate/nitrite-specific signal transduction histidine kinase
MIRFNSSMMLFIIGILWGFVLVLLAWDTFSNFLSVTSIRICISIISASGVYLCTVVFFARSTSSSIKIISHFVDRISSRTFEQRVPIPKNSETKDLAESFNRMAETFSRVYDGRWGNSR